MQSRRQRQRRTLRETAVSSASPPRRIFAHFLSENRKSGYARNRHELCQENPPRESGLHRNRTFFIGASSRAKAFLPGGVAIALWNSSFRTRKSKEIQALFFDFLCPGFAGFGPVWIRLGLQYAFHRESSVFQNLSSDFLFHVKHPPP